MDSPSFQFPFRIFPFQPETDAATIQNILFTEIEADGGVRNACKFFWNFDDIFLSAVGEFDGCTFDETTNINSNVWNSPNTIPPRRASNTGSLPTYRRKAWTTLTQTTPNRIEYAFDLRCGDSGIFHIDGRYGLAITFLLTIIKYVDYSATISLSLSIKALADIDPGDTAITPTLPATMEWSEATHKMVYAVTGSPSSCDIGILFNHSSYSYAPNKAGAANRPPQMVVDRVGDNIHVGDEGSQGIIDLGTFTEEETTTVRLPLTGAGSLKTGTLKTGGLSTSHLRTGKLRTGGLKTGGLKGARGLKTGTLTTGGLTLGKLTTGKLTRPVLQRTQLQGAHGLKIGGLRTGGLKCKGLETGTL